MGCAIHIDNDRKIWGRTVEEALNNFDTHLKEKYQTSVKKIIDGHNGGRRRRRRPQYGLPPDPDFRRVFRQRRMPR